MSILLACTASGCLLGEADLTSSEQALHSWGNYHWARTSNPFALALGDNVASIWDSYLAAARGDWSTSSVVDLAVVAGATRPKPCRATPGRVEVCAAKYGSTGWLGVASIWVSSSHITQGTVKLNDTYFATGTYNTPAWRGYVMCQEVGHTLGLDHQDEVFGNSNLGSCMDYTNAPSTNQTPNAHDYEQLELIYEHFDSTTTVGADIGFAPAEDSPSNWGQRVRSSADGHQAVYVRDRGAGLRVVTFVTWVEPHAE